MTILGAGWRQIDSRPTAASLAGGSRITRDSLTYTEWGGVHICVSRELYDRSIDRLSYDKDIITDLITLSHLETREQ